MMQLATPAPRDHRSTSPTTTTPTKTNRRSRSSLAPTYQNTKKKQAQGIPAADLKKLLEGGVHTVEALAHAS